MTNVEFYAAIQQKVKNLYEAFKDLDVLTTDASLSEADECVDLFEEGYPFTEDLGDLTQKIKEWSEAIKEYTNYLIAEEKSNS